MGLQEAWAVLTKTRGTLSCPGNNSQRLLGGSALHSHCYSCHLLWAILRVCMLRIAMVVLFSDVSCFAWPQLHLTNLSIRLNCSSEKARVRSSLLAWMSRIQQPLQASHFWVTRTRNRSCWYLHASVPFIAFSPSREWILTCGHDLDNFLYNIKI